MTNVTAIVFDIRVWRFVAFLRSPTPLCSTQSRSYTARMPDTHPRFINAVVGQPFKLRVFQRNGLIDDRGLGMNRAPSERELYSENCCNIFLTH